LSNPPIFVGIGDLEEFMEDTRLMVPKEQIVLELDETMRSTLSRWWDMYKDKLKHWEEV